MHRPYIKNAAIFAIALASTSTLAHAQSVTIPDEYSKHIQYSSQPGPITDEQFGDNINPATGNLEIIQTDLELRGNNELPIRIARRFRAGNDLDTFTYFGNWELDIPYLHGVFAYPNTVGGEAKSGWTIWAQMVGGTSSDIRKRCSLYAPPPPIATRTAIFDSHEYWKGNFIYLPGIGDQEMLGRNPSSQIPNDGKIYPVATKNGGVMRCLQSLDSIDTPGEGFEAIMPDGNIYTFNHMVAQTVASLYKPEPSLATAMGQPLDQTKASANTQPQAELTPMMQPPSTGSTLPRKEVRIYPTLIKDRFGNSLTYVWNTASPHKLDRIIASDGREVTFNYATENGQSIVRFSTGSRTWTYRIAATGGIDTLQLPNGSTWSFELNSIHTAKPYAYSGLCGTYPVDKGPFTGSITAPSGARVDYTMTARSFGRSWVIPSCITTSSGAQYLSDPNVFSSISIDSKKITGPGLPSAGQIWTYSYSPVTYCWYPGGGAQPNWPNTCTASSPTTRWVSVADPSGTVTRYTFSNRHAVDEGLLLKEESGWNGSTAFRTTTYEYAAPDAPPYGTISSYPMRSGGDAEVASRHHPQRKRVITQQGGTFTWQVASDCAGVPYCFDSYARPTKIISTSPP